jgi:hypothetical protein
MKSACFNPYGVAGSGSSPIFTSFTSSLAKHILRSVVVLPQKCSETPLVLLELFDAIELKARTVIPSTHRRRAPIEAARKSQMEEPMTLDQILDYPAYLCLCNLLERIKLKTTYIQCQERAERSRSIGKRNRSCGSQTHIS